MKIFATRVWGYHPATWPLVTFNTQGNLNNLLNKSENGDVVVFVGTKTENTHPDEQGRLLGMVQFSRDPIDTLSVLRTEDLLPEHYVNGQFKWPKAVAMTRAWEFEDIPLPYLTDVFHRQLPRNATYQAVELNDEDAEVVRNLAAKEIDLPEINVLEGLDQSDRQKYRKSRNQGPVPSAWKGGGRRTLGHKSATYAMRFGNTECWKIGWTIDVTNRINALNKHVPMEITKQNWEVYRLKSWENETLAYEMEQSVLKGLVKYQTSNERVVCPPDILDQMWSKYD